MKIKQLKSQGGDNFTYIIACDETGEALVVDPTGSVEQIIQTAQNMNCKIATIINTHGHYDHTSGNAALKNKSNAQIIMHRADVKNGDTVDRFLDQEEILKIGNVEIQIIHTPGHTPGGICLYVDGNLFTGDTLFVGDSGRTDLPGGNRAQLGASIRKLMQLDENTIVWPGHDYGPTPHSTLGWEKRHNVNAKEYGF